MIRSYHYHLLPTRAQERALLRQIALLRELYNAALEERRDAWNRQGVRVSVIDQMRQIPGVREVRPEFNDVPVIVMRGALQRLDRSFQSFFVRCRSGERPGFPRFKNAERFRSIIINDLTGYHSHRSGGPIVAGGKRVHLPMIGKVKFRQHRPLGGKPKAIWVKHERDGRWSVTFACADVAPALFPETGRAVGVDLGLNHFAVTSDGQVFENARPLADARLAVERAHRRLSRRRRGGKRHRKAAQLLARKYAHVAGIRREMHIGVARSLIATYDVIYVEKIGIRGLMQNHRLAKSIHDAGWWNFILWLRCKAESAGREVIEVPCRGTSQECSGCGGEVKKGLWVRTHRCKKCGLVLDRDENAARVILSRGRRDRGGAALVRARRGSEKVKSSTAGKRKPLAGRGAN